MAGAHSGSIFPEAHIAHVVDRFNGPVAAPEGLQLSGVHWGSGPTAQYDFGFLGDTHRLEMVSGTGNDGGLNGVGKAGLRGTQFTGIDLAGFMSAVAPGPRHLDKRTGCVRAGKDFGGAIAAERG